MLVWPQENERLAFRHSLRLRAAITKWVNYWAVSKKRVKYRYLPAQIDHLVAARERLIVLFSVPARPQQRQKNIGLADRKLKTMSFSYISFPDGHA